MVRQMTERLRFNPTPVAPPGTLQPTAAKKSPAEPGFAAVLEETLARQKVKFSAHAMERLRQRNLELDESDLAKLGSAMEKARQKGVKSSLILLGETAFIAGVNTNTIITAVDASQVKDHVFTGIDGAIIIK